MKTAILLAAGAGTRLRPLTDSQAKCCVSVAGASLICRVVRQLLTCEPAIRIYVVVGYQAKKVREELAPFGHSIEIVENFDYATTNNMESCRMALEARNDDVSSLIINGDCIYDDEIIARMYAVAGDTIATDASVYYEESMKVRCIDGDLREISKALPKRSDTMTSIDIYSFTPKSLSFLHKTMCDYRDAGDCNQWTEVAISRLLEHCDSAVKPLDFSGLRWVEIDNFNDLSRAEDLWG